MKNNNQKTFWIIAVLSVMLSSALYAVSITCFINAPGSDLLPAGVSGLATIVSRYIIKGNNALWYSIIYFSLNVPLFILAFKTIGKWFSIITFCNVILTSIFIAIMPSKIAELLKVSSMPMLDISLFAAVLSGVSIGVALMANASTGGTDILSLFFSIKKGQSIGKYIRLLNLAIITFGGILSRNLNAMLYTVVYLTVESVVIDLVYRRTKKVFLEVITTKGDDIRKALIENSTHGSTILKGEGGYSYQEKTIIHMVVSSRQTNEMIKLVKDIDPNSFTILMPVDQVYGKFYIPAFK